MILRWFISSAWRSAFAARKHYRHLLAARRDGLSPEAIAAVQLALNELDAAMAQRHTGRMRIKIEELQFAASQWISPYPNHVWRANIEVLLVALVVALGIRTFFLQPFKIPTGSMQPTLYGVTYENLTGQPDFELPQGLERVRNWFAGVTYLQVVAQADGVVEKIGPVTPFLMFNLRQSFWLGGVEHVVWFPPDVGDSGQGITHLLARQLWVTRQYYHKGDDVIRLRRGAGDYLLADRLTYNFRKPARGEIIVFKTQGIGADARKHYGIPADEFYIKRLVGLPGEQVRIGNDRHLIINGHRLDAATPHFASLYSFDPTQPLRTQQYLGHLNGWVARQYNLGLNFAPLFPDEDTVFAIAPGQCLPMGDNTVDSLDSRYWGALSDDAIVGKCFFVFWPLTKRFGWGNQ